MSWLYSLLLTSCMLFGIFLRYKPFASALKHKTKVILIVHYVGLCLLNYIAVGLFINYFGLNFVADYLRFGAIFFAIIATTLNIIFIEKRIKEHIFVFGIVLNVNYILMTIPNFAFNYLPVMSADSYILILLFSFLILLGIVYVPLKSVLCKTITPFLYFESKEYWTNVFIIPVAYFVSKYVNMGGQHNTGNILQVLSSIISGTVLILVCLSIADDGVRMTYGFEMEKQLSMQKLYYQELKEKVEHARRERHDLKHHVTAIRHFVATDDKSGLIKYCNDWISESSHETAVPYTGNGVVDGLIYQYAEKASKNDIRFEYVGSIRNNCLPDLDICVLLGNALDNAFEATAKLEAGERNVAIVFQNEASLLSVMIKNTFNGVVHKDKTGFLSSKREHRHGIGIASMEKICDKYGGTLNITWDESSFIVMIMLPIE